MDMVDKPFVILNDEIDALATRENCNGICVLLLCKMEDDSEVVAHEDLRLILVLLTRVLRLMFPYSEAQRHEIRSYLEYVGYLYQKMEPLPEQDDLSKNKKVSPDLYGDNTRLFTYWTSDGYQATGCYNLLCSGFIQINSDIAMGATISPVSEFSHASNGHLHHGHNVTINPSTFIGIKPSNYDNSSSSGPFEMEARQLPCKRKAAEFQD
ncbi:hypothetical protein L1987_08914 [Smallanthus sonchifolius]|uniref:Uncharacterized protein n=1 Tax=Smallanthus sonchifolius TaxID=185202 RepID=A0ACB9JLH9_9ASTR|nr:hypothetical protein L1987_08914 [Smallanthus sonchifolius]